MGQLKPGGSERRATARRSGESRPEENAPNGSVRLGTYLRRLREGYGYTLRKVEERAMAIGEAIDNSQLSRFEKGKAVPSFDKLRALARVFNVPVQNFSDVLDLEDFQHLKPEHENYAELLREGKELATRGEHGRAFVTYERALEVAESLEQGSSERTSEMAVEARWRMACALKRMGKLYMTERELREILKLRSQLAPHTRLRTLLQLSYLYRELGDLYLSSVIANECLELARRHGDAKSEAGVLNTLGNIHEAELQFERAEEHYRQSLEVLGGLSGHQEMHATVMTNLGGCLVSMGQAEIGMAMLDDAHGRATQGGYRRIAALSLTRLAEAHRQSREPTAARERLSESDALASRSDGCFYDILFLNTFHRWTMARQEGNATGEKIAFGRLRHLRSLLQRRFPEVEEFDRRIERTRR